MPTQATHPVPALRHPASDFIGGRWMKLEHFGAGAICVRNPAHPERILWTGRPEIGHVQSAVDAARRALPAWSRLPRERRFGVLRRFAAICKARESDMADVLCDEIGKPLWEARGEASILANKVDITLDETEIGPLRRVTGYEFNAGATRSGRCWYRPHGVMAVLGPFNFPAHLPNGHIVPALAMGNTVVFKPSDKAPCTAQLLVELLQQALEESDLPDNGAGIVNLVHGGAEPAMSLVTNRGVDGVLFTGSWPVGRRILEANLDHPGKIVALELGGNNPVVVMPDADLRQAAIEIVRCAFNTTGQRCTSTRRVIVHEAAAKKLIPAICHAATALSIGDPRAAQPVFMGPIINKAARDAVLSAQSVFEREGGEVLVRAREVGEAGDGWFISPSVIRVEKFTRDQFGAAGCDTEIFGPLLRIATVRHLDEAIEQANATSYGLAASIFTHDERAIEFFLAEAHAGCVNINTGTAGASSKLPFGGVGHSGNHRPAGAFSLDYCAYPVAGMIERGSAATLAEGMRFDDAWLS
jgi:succinylglutamic semialdehyde dehydrogenase